MKPLCATPHEAVVLGVDPARVSGWAVVQGTRLLASGTAKSIDDRTCAVDEAVGHAFKRNLPLVCVAEDWPSGAFRNRSAYGSCREFWGRWAERCDDAAFVVRVYTQTWRSGLGLRAKGSEAWKAAAIEAARLLFGAGVAADEAEAICIAAWGSRSVEVGKVLRKEERRQARIRKIVEAA